MYNDPRLSTPVISSIVSTILLVIAWKIDFDSRLDWLRLIFLFIGIIFLAAALVTGLDYFMAKFAIHLKAVTEANRSADIRLAQLIQNMTPRQLEVLENGGIIRVTGKPVDGYMSWFLHTGQIDIPMAWIVNYLHECEATFPEMPPQHGLGNTQERAYRRAFHGWITNGQWGIARQAVGNKSPAWIVPNMSNVYELFGVEQ